MEERQPLLASLQGAHVEISQLVRALETTKKREHLESQSVATSARAPSRSGGGDAAAKRLKLLDAAAELRRCAADMRAATAARGAAVAGVVADRSARRVPRSEACRMLGYPAAVAPQKRGPAAAAPFFTLAHCGSGGRCATAALDVEGVPAAALFKALMVEAFRTPTDAAGGKILVLRALDDRVAVRVDRRASLEFGTAPSTPGDAPHAVFAALADLAAARALAAHVRGSARLLPPMVDLYAHVLSRAELADALRRGGPALAARVATAAPWAADPARLLAPGRARRDGD